ADLPAGVEYRVWHGLDQIPAYSEDVHPAPLPVIAFRQAFAQADAVLFATPEYNASIPGALRNALDWVSRPFDTNPLCEKPVRRRRRQPGRLRHHLGTGRTAKGPANDRCTSQRTRARHPSRTAGLQREWGAARSGGRD